ncbi:hypothetical protein FGO68_gene9003 [Halteria grandinella]|uniref:Uncharacterized protein n=1 Tax=Halteria grandinella TaxID=5974 RepID=A0A8J8NE28_HALGN|nr:hypothetical protein FGO68_gene9003 [Halteria grandinella]
MKRRRHYALMRINQRKQTSGTRQLIDMQTNSRKVIRLIHKDQFSKSLLCQNSKSEKLSELATKNAGPSQTSPFVVITKRICLYVLYKGIHCEGLVLLKMSKG